MKSLGRPDEPGVGRDHVLVVEEAAMGDFVGSFRTLAREPDDLWPWRIAEMSKSDAAETAEVLWLVIARQGDPDRRRLEGAPSRAATDLVPPIDRRYTFRFFTGQKAVYGGEERAFMVERSGFHRPAARRDRRRPHLHLLGLKNRLPSRGRDPTGHGGAPVGALDRLGSNGWCDVVGLVLGLGLER